MNGPPTLEQDSCRLTGGPVAVLGRERTCAQKLELAAREELESRAGRRLSDEEWAATRRGLLAFMKILRGWDEPKMDDRDGKVVVMLEDYPKAA